MSALEPTKMLIARCLVRVRLRLHLCVGLCACVCVCEIPWVVTAGNFPGIVLLQLLGGHQVAAAVPYRR